MKAIAAKHYGGREVLKLTELPPPKVGPDYVLIRAKAAGVNPVDAKIRNGNLEERFHVHFPLIPGWDVAGIVESVGPDVTEFKPGDEVLAYARRDEIQWGTYAELVSAPLRTVASKPAGLGWAEAAALPLAGLTAWQVLSRGAKITDEDVVLIHAAAGGVGSFAVQIARMSGARVIGTGSEASHDHLRALGAEPVIYGDNLVSGVRSLAAEGVSVIVDLVGGPTLDLSPKLLRPAGKVVSIRDPQTPAKFGGRYIFVRPDSAALSHLAGLAAGGKLSVTIQERLPLQEAARAHMLIESGHVRGKLVLDIGAAEG